VQISIDAVKKQRRFVCWNREVVKGKETKVPYMPSGCHAKSNGPATWSTYAECEAATGFDGIGIVLGRVDGVPVTGVDFDECCDAFEGHFTPESRKTIIALDSYSEYSPNGYGAHVLCLADFPEEYRGVNTGKKGDSIVRPGPDFKQIEIKGSGFYFTLSGRHLSKTPADLMPRQEQINALCKHVAGMQAKPGIVVSAGTEEEKYRKLMAGDLSDFDGDHSRADLTLCNLLARRLNNNSYAIDAAWLKSPLYREKLEREDYRSMTILKAIKGGALVFDEEEPMDEDAPTIWTIQPLPKREEGWFPLGEVSLVGGPSGAGKTHSLLRMAEDARQGRETYGHATTASDYCLLLHDRSSASMRRTCNAAKLPVPVDEIMSRVIRLTRAQQKERPAAVIEAMIQSRPGVKLWILEGLDFWTPDLHKLDAVGDVLDELQRVAKQYRVAIVGTLGSPKQKENDRYASGRDQFMGSVAFGRKSETCISIEKTADKNVRKMNVMPRNTAKEEFFFTWTDAGLTLTTEPSEPDTKDENSALARMEAQVFAATPVGEELKYHKHFGSASAFFRWRRVAQAEGKVTLSGKKYYRAYAGGVECGEDAVQ
jgi:hypothetical protein